MKDLRQPVREAINQVSDVGWLEISGAQFGWPVEVVPLHRRTAAEIQSKVVKWSRGDKAHAFSIRRTTQKGLMPGG